MPDLKGFRLFVNLSASQTRRRLKHFGHGVRKIQSAGKNQAVVIHTATDGHLDALQAKFADVGCSTNNRMSEPVQNLHKIGSSSAALLRDVGVFTVTDLVSVGPIRAYQMVKEMHPETNIALLEAIAIGLREYGLQEVATELD